MGKYIDNSFEFLDPRATLEENQKLFEDQYKTFLLDIIERHKDLERLLLEGICLFSTAQIASSTGTSEQEISHFTTENVAVDWLLIIRKYTNEVYDTWFDEELAKRGWTKNTPHGGDLTAREHFRETYCGVRNMIHTIGRHMCWFVVRLFKKLKQAFEDTSKGWEPEMIHKLVKEVQSCKALKFSLSSGDPSAADLTKRLAAAVHATALKEVQILHVAGYFKANGRLPLPTRVDVLEAVKESGYSLSQLFEVTSCTEMRRKVKYEMKCRNPSQTMYQMIVASNEPTYAVAPRSGEVSFAPCRHSFRS